MTRSPLIRPADAQLRKLMQALEVDVVRLTECLVSPGWCLASRGSDVAGLHYNLAGSGRIAVEGNQPVHVQPHTLIIIPPRMPFRFEVDGPGGRLTTMNLTRPDDEEHGAFHRFEAGDSDPRMTLTVAASELIMAGNKTCSPNSKPRSSSGSRRKTGWTIA